MIWILIVLSVSLAIMGIVILIGKGDKLIAGYNTASPEEQAKYHVKRLRGLIGGLLIVLAPAMFMLAGEPSTATSMSFSCLVLILAFVVVILANTWAKKKTK